MSVTLYLSKLLKHLMAMNFLRWLMVARQETLIYFPGSSFSLVLFWDSSTRYTCSSNLNGQIYNGIKEKPGTRCFDVFSSKSIKSSVVNLDPNYFPILRIRIHMKTFFCLKLFKVLVLFIFLKCSMVRWQSTQYIRRNCLTCASPCWYWHLVCCPLPPYKD